MPEELEKRPDIATRFQPGNQLWRIGNRGGAPRKYQNEEDIAKEAQKYFQWVESNPMIEYKPFHHQGDVVVEPIPRMRPMTLKGLCISMGIHHTTWCEYRKNPVLSRVCGEVDQIIENQQYEGAAAGFLKENIVGRYLGLTDKQEINVMQSDGEDEKAMEYARMNFNSEQAKRLVDLTNVEKMSIFDAVELIKGEVKGTIWNS